MLDPKFKEIADKGAAALEDVRQKFIDADAAFMEKAGELGLDVIASFVTLISLHRAASDEMERKLHEVIFKLTGVDPTDPTETDDEEE